jgi:cobalt-zinc-cadmium resistance protein CzcA
VLTQQGGVPVLLSDVAKVQIGFVPRLGIAGRDDDRRRLRHRADAEARTHHGRGDSACARRSSAQHRRQLPPGVQIDAVLRPRRSRRDHGAHRAAQSAFGIALIFLIQWVFLGNLRCALIVAATIPVALFLAVIITVLRGESANLLSVGAIDLGIIVDATVIMVENIFRHLAHPRIAERDRDAR